MQFIQPATYIPKGFSIIRGFGTSSVFSSMRTITLVLVFCFTTFLPKAQTGTVSAVRSFVQQHRDTILSEFETFLSIPSIAKDTANLLRTADYLLHVMRSRGIDHVQLLEADTKNVPPVIYGDIKTPGATQTLIFYAHYDGQPVNPAQWAKGLDPFQPTLFSNALYKNGTPIDQKQLKIIQDEWRLYARGASDDKAGVMAIINAYAALVQSGQQPTCNIKFFFEGEEERGSPHLGEIIEKYKPLLQSDGWIICDGPVHQSGNKQLVFGVRGDAHLDLTVYGPKRPLHSGHYGNWIPNPALLLAQLLASMKDENGRVTVTGFYDDAIPLSTAEKKALAEAPDVGKQLKEELGIHKTDMPGLSLGEAISLPSLNINGMASGNVGPLSSNQIPTNATAVLDLRLVPGNDWRKQQQKVIDHIKAQGYYVIDHEPTDEERLQHDRVIKIIVDDDGYNAQRTPMDWPLAQRIIKAVKKTTTTPVVLQPSSGGSLPLYLIEELLNAKPVTVPIANYDNNQHAENENIRLGNFFEGIVTLATIMQM
jgi:acetylornithine deacetylase/succinyl-diaminopimelate desuccinylase-like protein